MDDIRLIVFESLLECEKGDLAPGIIGKNMMDKYAYLDKQQRSFMHCLYEGVIDKKITLDYVIDKLSKVPVKKMKKPVKCIVRMGAYQILFMNSVPDRAACNEAVLLAKKKHLGNLSGFINGVLRGICRLDEIEYPNKRNEGKKYLSIKYSLPEIILDSLIKDYGLEKTEEVLNNLENDRPVLGRTEICRITTAELTKRLNAYENVDVSRIENMDAFVFNKLDQLDDIPEFEKGLFTIQDISSQLIGYIAGYKKGDTVIDVCAAPGGKSMHAGDILTYLSNGDNISGNAAGGRVISCDVSDNKLERISENIERLQLNNVTVLLRDAAGNTPAMEERADVVLCDVPCSGLGIMARKRDIKYGLTEEGLSSLTELQRKIINQSVKLVKSGGTFIYSTCTMRKEENDEQFSYITNELGLEPVDFYDDLPQNYRAESAKKGFLQLFPGEQGTDGFFMAKFHTRA